VDVVISEHARFEMVRRQISEEVVRNVAQDPQQTIELSSKCTVCQSRYYDTVEGSEMLLRVICEKRRSTSFIITAYKTSKVDKYWKKEI